MPAIASLEKNAASVKMNKYKIHEMYRNKNFKDELYFLSDVVYDVDRCYAVLIGDHFSFFLEPIEKFMNNYVRIDKDEFGCLKEVEE